MKFNAILLSFLLCLFLWTSVLATELPPSPNGYSWVRCNEILGAFLKPTGWYFKKSIQGDTLGYFITKENIDELGAFETGLTVNVIPKIPQKKSMQASIFAKSYIEVAVESREVFKRAWSNQMGPFEAYGVVLVNRDKEQGDFVTHNLAIANDQTGTVYLITFEGPLSEWESSWKIAEPMLQKFLIDDTI